MSFTVENAVDRWNEALLHLAARRHAAAEACCQRAIASAPERPLPHAMLAWLFHRRGLLRPSKFHAHEACRCATGAGWRDVLRVSATLASIDEMQLAREVLAFIDPDEPTRPSELVAIARQFQAVGDDPSARYLLHRALQLAARERPMRLPAHG